MAKINFNLRDNKSQTATPVNVVIRWDNRKLVFPSGETIIPLFWDTDLQRGKAIKKNIGYPEFNERLTKLETLIIKSFRDFTNDFERVPEVAEFRQRLQILTNRIEKDTKLNLMGFIAKFREKAITKINRHTGKTFTAQTQTAYKQLNDLLIEFSKNRKGKLNFEDIDFEFYTDFTKFLTDKKEFSINTIGKHIKTLKTILNAAVEDKLTDNLKFKSDKFAVSKQATDSIYLSEKELRLINQIDLSKDEKLDRVRDLFLVGCYTGLRFSDLSKIKQTDIKGDYFEIETQKTGQKVAIPVHETIREILAKRKGNFPKAISNQKMNEYLKLICKKEPQFYELVSLKENKAGVTFYKNHPKFELVTTHTARRSFATNNYKLGIPNHVIMAITGHKTEKSFLTYIKVTPTEKAEVMKLHWAKLSNLKVS
jgi:integrase